MAEVRTRGGRGSSTMRARVMWSIGICCASAVNRRGARSRGGARREYEVHSSGSVVHKRGACSSSSTRRESEVYSIGSAVHERGACSSGSRGRGCEMSNSDSAVRKRGARSSDSVGRVSGVRAAVTASGVYVRRAP
jgi:hypothetical protein